MITTTFLPVTPNLRQRIEMTVENLVALLDEIDGDPELEDGHDAEAVNEDGGDINDEPQDTDEREPLLSSSEICGQGVDVNIASWQDRDAAFGPGGMMDGWTWYDGEAAE